MRKFITAGAAIAVAALAFAGCGSSVNEQAVGTTAGDTFVACYSKTSPPSVTNVQSGFQTYATGQSVQGCAPSKALTKKGARRRKRDRRSLQGEGRCRCQGAS